MILHRAVINGIDIAARYSERAVDTIFVPLLKHFSTLQREKGRRILVMLAAPPGCGKTTLLSFWDMLSRSLAELDPIQVIGMDGFHRRQEYLLQHTIERGGRSIPMVEIKGAPVTFDLELLTANIQRVAEGERCGWPVYDRMLHNPIENALQVDGEIVLLEGNYLLLDEDGWRTLSAFADYTISITAGETLLRNRLIERRIRTGVEREAAIRFVDFSDMPNVRLCLEKTLPADCMLRLDEQGDYHFAGTDQVPF